MFRFSAPILASGAGQIAFGKDLFFNINALPKEQVVSAENSGLPQWRCRCECKSEWYLFYHHNDYSPQFDKNRSARIDRVIFNEDGTIQPVTPTLRGVGISPARSIIQLDRYSFLSQGGTYIDFLNVENPFEGWFVSLPRPETWVEYEDIDFGSASPKTVKMRVRSEKGARVAFSAAENQYFAHMDIPASAAWTEVSAPMESELTGLNYVRAVVESGDVQIDWMTFE